MTAVCEANQQASTATSFIVVLPCQAAADNIKTHTAISTTVRNVRRILVRWPTIKALHKGLPKPCYYTLRKAKCALQITEQKRRNDGGAHPAMLKPRGREHLFTPAIFSHIFACCSSNFHSLSLCCLHTIKTSHSHSVGTRGRIHAF